MTGGTPSDAPFRVSHAMPSFDVDDLNAAIDWFGRIGFAEAWRYPDQSPTHAGVCSGELTIMLASEPGAEIKPHGVYVFVRGIEAYHAHCVAGLGEGAVPPLVSADYGMRDFQLRTPWGHHITFGEADEQASG